MKVTVECTPEEARRMMGLPDLSSLHEAYLEKLRTMMVDGLTPDAAAELMKSWGPMTEGGMNIWSQMLEQMSGRK